MSALDTALGEIIGAIGERGFPMQVAGALRRFTAFDLAAVVLHRTGGEARILSDNFDQIGCRQGIETYARATHRLNPMLASRRAAAVRARDFAHLPDGRLRAMQRHIVRAEDEELGYRTLGWPPRHEEIGLYFEGWGGVIELGFYRARARRAAPHGTLQALTALRSSIAAAFERHKVLSREGDADAWHAPLSVREREVGELLLLGCSSDAIALRLGISRHTVKDHRKHIFRKLEIASLAELFALAR
jgi:DNA-binding CsgD family transcriptional regulator